MVVQLGMNVARGDKRAIPTHIFRKYSHFVL